MNIDLYIHKNNNPAPLLLIGTMASQSHQLHFVLFPLIAQGHLIPMFDIARMLARHGVIVTIVTTRLNAKRFAIPLARAAESGLQIRALVVEVLKIGVSVGSQVTLKWGEEEKFGVLVKKEQVKNAVNSVMNVGEESEERRRRARELGKMANKAVEEEGSSYLSMKLLIEDIRKKTFAE
ncbi:hypothetical protein OIU84_001867 [Salix udensis]|uniref:Uncharacterized protein n=1 Tax=Salix udensis TaxID=889485 RepID=A0AAD6P6E1_9ROSI|nr:hypothetical protein OIU84_001867 [Salix udensis]